MIIILCQQQLSDRRQEDKDQTILPSINIRQPEFTKFMASDWSISFCEAQGNATSHLSLQGFASS